MDNAGTLLRQVKRLEQDLSGLTAEEGENSGISPVEAESGNISDKQDSVDSLKNEVNRAAGEVNILRFGREMPEETETGNVNPIEKAGDMRPLARRAGVPSAAGEIWTERPALAVQLEQADRAASVPAELETGRQKRKGREDGLSLPGRRSGGDALQTAGLTEEGRSGGGSAFRPGPGGEMLWAEQADRAFRRDSRRYDGGFYLY